MNSGRNVRNYRRVELARSLGPNHWGSTPCDWASVNDPLPNRIYLFRFTYFWALHLGLSEEDLSQIGGIAFVAFYQAQGLIHSPL